MPTIDLSLTLEDPNRGYLYERHPDTMYVYYIVNGDIDTLLTFDFSLLKGSEAVLVGNKLRQLKKQAEQDGNVSLIGKIEEAYYRFMSVENFFVKDVLDSIIADIKGVLDSRNNLSDRSNIMKSMQAENVLSQGKMFGLGYLKSCFGEDFDVSKIKAQIDDILSGGILEKATKKMFS